MYDTDTSLTINDSELVQEDTQKGKYLTFTIDNEEYGIEIYYVIEIISMQNIMKVPHTPEYIKGIINLRGAVIPVLEVRSRFKKPPAVYDDLTCIIVTEYEDITIGLIVDNVKDVANIKWDDIQPPPSVKTGYHNKYISRIGKTESGVKLLLALDKLLNDEDDFYL